MVLSFPGLGSIDSPFQIVVLFLENPVPDLCLSDPGLTRIYRKEVTLLSGIDQLVKNSLTVVLVFSLYQEGFYFSFFDSGIYPQDRRSYYLGFNYMIFNYMSVLVNGRRFLARVLVNGRRFLARVLVNGRG